MTNSKESQPIISVIVPVYNQELYIGRCLRSLLHQSINHENYEIIVIDDGSTDRTPYALELFSDKFNSPIVVLKNSTNSGLPASLNKAILNSRSEYIVRVDSDDFVNVNFLTFLYNFIEFNKYADAVACDYYLVNDNEEVLQRVNCLEHPIACGILYKKSHLIELGMYDESFKCHEERDFRIRFEKKYMINRLELPLYRYRRHEDNMTNNKSQMEYFEMQLQEKHKTANLDKN
jgi:glycosyltransferase involved in cell wall biosynthesis